MSKFIGRRIVPKHDGVWDINKEYEELSIVLDKASGESYISRRPVPVGTAISDEIYWMQYSLYSAQIAEAVKEMEDTEARLIQYVDTAESNMNSRVNSAESLTNSNKAELNSRMDTLDKRLDANVSASTDKDKDYAAEVVDANTTETCPTCFGKGTIKSSILFTDTLESKIDYLVNKLKIKKFSLHIHPYIAAYVNQGLVSLKRKWQMKYGFGIKIIPNQKLAFLEYVFYDLQGEEIDMKEEIEIK